ncbi:MAG: 50S ribosomal protein L24e [Nanoarchaeota archaeon]
MPKCSYCGEQYEPPRGLTLVFNDGTPRYFCSSKCRKNFFLKRRKVRWISKKRE